MIRLVSWGRAAVACLVLLVVASAGQSQAPPGKREAAAHASRAGRRSSLFNLTPGAGSVLLTANRVLCPIWSFGNSCFDYETEGGFWPAGTQDNYVFNGGLQVAAEVPSSAGFTWAGDTVGVFFMDPRGQREGIPVAGIFNSLNASDLAAWPTAAYANDPALFNSRLLGRAAISDQDTWVRYWDGNPALTYGRKHMMGMVVDQRSLVWNRPFHQDMVYFIFRLINITSRLPQSYAGLAAAGYSAADQQQLAALGAQFQDSAKGREPTLQMPDSGYTFSDLFVAYNQDPDVGNADFNYSTAVLPFSLVAAMKSNYSEPVWQYPLNIFGGSFAPAPGYEAVEWLRGAADSGGGRSRIRIWSNTCGGCGILNDAIGVPQMFRYLSGTMQEATGDGACSFNPVTRACAAIQAYSDTRFFSSTGPANLGPGQSLVVAAAMIYAAPLAQWAATSNGNYAMPAGQLSPYENAAAQATFTPGYPASPDTLALIGTAGGARLCTTACNATGTVREPVERAMGWGQFSDANGDGLIEENEVTTAPGSLLYKAQVAQALFDDKFLMPTAPASPAFFLIPGDGQVTVAWQRSATETVSAGGGDPYFAVASDETSALYDPDYRQYDVEGYRIWRGTSASNLAVIAQFDYAGTTFMDYTGQVFDPNNPNCAPELGLGTTANCAVNFQSGVGANIAWDLASPIVQVPLGGRILLANGAVALVQADTALSGGGKDFPGLTDGGVPFAFSDPNVRNGFPYVYAVTAFDVNSIRSGPSSLESPLVTRMVTPRVGSGQQTAGSIGALQLLGAGGQPIPAGVMPTINQNTGIFSGPMPPSNGVGIGFLAFLPQVVGTDSLTLTIDSVVPTAAAYNDAGTGIYYLTSYSPAAGTVHSAFPIQVDFTSQLDSSGSIFPAVYAAQAKAAAYGGDSTFAVLGQMYLRSPGAWDLTNWGRGAANCYPGCGNRGKNGPVWWDRTANDTTPNPWAGMCSGSCATGPFPANPGITAGTLTGAQVMYIQAYETVQSTPMRQLHATLAYVVRAADFRVYWGAGGAIDSVIDATHLLPVLFSTKLRASWGILNDSSFTNTAAANTEDANNGLLTWTDVACVDPAPAAVGACTGTTPAFLMNHARLSPVHFGGSAFAAAPTLTATGNGFIFYLAGHFFVMQMAALPAQGTLWNLRTYAGSVLGDSGSYSFAPQVRPPAVPGLRLRITFQGSVLNPKVTNAAELAAVHTVPDPYYNHDDYETVGSPREIRFVNLPAQCIIHIYSTSGILVTALTHNDPTGGGEEPWNVLSRNGRLVASGVYFWHVTTPDGRQKVGRMTIINISTS